MDLVIAGDLPAETPLRAAIRDAHRLDEIEADLRNPRRRRHARRRARPDRRYAPAPWSRRCGASGSARAGSTLFCMNTRCPRPRAWR